MYMCTQYNHTYTWTHVCTHTQTNIHMLVCICTQYTHAHAHIHVCLHMHKHICVRVCAHTNVLSLPLFHGVLSFLIFQVEFHFLSSLGFFLIPFFPHLSLNPASLLPPASPFLDIIPMQAYFGSFCCYTVDTWQPARLRAASAECS